MPETPGKRFGPTGKYPEDHPNRCQFRLRQGFEHYERSERPYACDNFAIRGKHYCVRHKMYNVGGRNRMPRIYTRITKSLQERLAELDESAPDRMHLREELDLVRVSAEDVVALFSITRDLKAEAEEAYHAIAEDGEAKVAAKKRLDGMIAAANATAESMRNVLEAVRATALDAARVEALTSSKFTGQAVQQIINQVVQMLYKVCGDEHKDIAEEFEMLVGTQIRVTETVEGTLITPDRDALEMDDTIPRITA